MYAEHGSQALLDALVAVHGLQGSLWKNPFLTELHMRKLDIMSMQRKTMATMCPAYYVLRNTLCRITFDGNIFFFLFRAAPMAYGSS